MMSTCCAMFAAIVLAVLPLSIYSQDFHDMETSTWRMVGHLPSQHFGGEVVRIGTNRAMVIGGYHTAVHTGGANVGARDVSLITLENDQVTLTALSPMNQGRAAFLAINVGDSLVYVFGGLDESNVAQNSVEVYSVRDNTWSYITPMHGGRFQHGGYIVNDTAVVMAGGRETDLSTIRSAEIYSLTSLQSRSIADYPVPINGAVSGIISEGRGVLVGGRDGGAVSSRPNVNRVPELYTYDILMDRWVIAGRLTEGRSGMLACKMLDGRFIFIGGSCQDRGPAIFSREVIRESNERFNVICSMPYAVIQAAVAECYPDILVVAGGLNQQLVSTDSTAFINTGTGAVIPGPRLNISRRLTYGVCLYETNPERAYTFAIAGVVSKNGSEVPEYSVEVLPPVKCDPDANRVTLSGADNIRTAGAAQMVNDSIRLTSHATFQAGAAWSIQKVDVTKPFTMDFAFRFSNGSDSATPDTGDPGADGIALVFQNTSTQAFGITGQGIGYDGLMNAVAIEFDAYKNTACYDPSTSHVAVLSAKNDRIHAWHHAPYGVAMNSTIPEFTGNRTYHARIQYDLASLKVYLGTTTNHTSPVIDVSGFSFSRHMELPPAGGVYVGFTSATGLASQQQDVTNWVVRGCDLLQNGTSGIDVGTYETGGSVMNVVPLPAHTVAKIQLPLTMDLTSSYTAYIIDASGRIASSMPVDVTVPVLEVMTEAFASGVYSVVISNGIQSFVVALPVVH